MTHGVRTRGASEVARMTLPAGPKRRRSLDLHFNAVMASCGSKLSDPARCNKAGGSRGGVDAGGRLRRVGVWCLSDIQGGGGQSRVWLIGLGVEPLARNPPPPPPFFCRGPGQARGGGRGRGGPVWGWAKSLFVFYLLEKQGSWNFEGGRRDRCGVGREWDLESRPGPECWACGSRPVMDLCLYELVPFSPFVKHEASRCRLWHVKQNGNSVSRNIPGQCHFPRCQRLHFGMQVFERVLSPESGNNLARQWRSPPPLFSCSCMWRLVGKNSLICEVALLTPSL